MQINRDTSTYTPPYAIVILDATDAYYYADVMDNMESFDTVDSFELAKELADALFVVKNYKWESLEAMNHVDGGYDVRVYDKNLSCVFAAHERYKNKWIGKKISRLLSKRKIILVKGEVLDFFMKGYFTIKLLEDLYLSNEDNKLPKFEKCHCEIYKDDNLVFQADSLNEALSKTSAKYKPDNKFHSYNVFNTIRHNGSYLESLRLKFINEG